MSQTTPPRRVIVPTEKYLSEEILPGVLFGQFHPGGKEGPNGEVGYPIPGGQAWTEYTLLGGRTDPFQMLIPDIRMPANQYWPLHWHDTWTVVLIIEGSCTVGDWQMQPGDIFITEPSLEYGPLLIGPKGCRLLEIFAQGQGGRGGYAPEYRDHPTLQGTDSVFTERSTLNLRNAGRQILSLENIGGIVKTRLAPGERWVLGDPANSDSGFMCDTRLTPDETIRPHRYGDWHAMLVIGGAIEVAGRTIDVDGYLFIAPDSEVGEIKAGAQGAQLVELARTLRGAERQFIS